MVLSFFQALSHLLGHPEHLGRPYWVPGPADAALGNNLTSPSLFIGPGVQVLLPRTQTRVRTGGFKLAGHGLFPEGYGGI